MVMAAACRTTRNSTERAKPARTKAERREKEGRREKEATPGFANTPKSGIAVSVPHLICATSSNVESDESSAKTLSFGVVNLF